MSKAALAQAPAGRGKDCRMTTAKLLSTLKEGVRVYAYAVHDIGARQWPGQPIFSAPCPVQPDQGRASPAKPATAGRGSSN